MSINSRDIYDELLVEAKRELDNVKHEKVLLEEYLRKIKMVEFAGKYASVGNVLSLEEQRFLGEFSQKLADLESKAEFWQMRLMALEAYDVQSFLESYEDEMEKRWVSPTPTPPTPVSPTPTPVPPTPTVTPVPGPVAGETRVWEKDGSVVVYIPPGEFPMGLSLYPDGNEYPQHTIYLDGFWIGKHPVTNAQYRKCVEAGACKTPQDRDYYRKPEYANCPVVYVDWYRAQAYARWAGGRLPTEAEWEKAARGTDGRTYPWGNVWDPRKCNTKDGGPGDLTPIGKYSPTGDSPYSVSGMAGNVWDWTSSLLRPYPYNPHDGREDPHSRGEDRVARGGGWSYVPDASRSWFRYPVYPGDGRFSLGFRLVYPVSSHSGG